MTIGLFVEGKSDKDTIPILIHKILKPHGVSPRVLTRKIPRGQMFDPLKVKPYAEHLLKQHPGTSKIVICVDCECTDPSDIQDKVEAAQRKLAELGLRPVPRYVVVVHALESWLAADVQALKRVAGMQHLRIRQNPESVCRPADLLKDVFGRAGKSFEKTRHDPRIARAADLSRIERRSPSFRRFREFIEDP